MINYLPKLLNLYEIMGDDMFCFMKKMIETSPNNIDRYFKNLPLIKDKYFPSLQIMKKRFPEICYKLSVYENILIQIGQFEELTREEKTINLLDSKYPDTTEQRFFEKYEQACQIHTPEEISKLFTDEIILLYKLILKLPLDEDYDFSKFLNKQSLFTSLIMGRKAMKDKYLCKVFDYIIKSKIKIKTNTIETEKLGIKLTKFNLQIADQLKSNGIDTESAFHYPRTVEFSTGSIDMKVDINRIEETVCTDLKNVNKTLEHLQKSSNSSTLFAGEKTNLIKSIFSTINKLITQVNKSKTPNYSLISKNEILRNSRHKIATQLKELLNLENLPAEVIEHGNHFLNRNKQLNDANDKSNPQHKSLPRKKFTVQQWDKSQLETFMLGSYLSCCLAPDAGQFPAMVQRWLDDAMMMHVIIDKESEEPVCGNWLFFGRDETNNIHVVANFFEIRAGLGQNKELRDILVQQLTEFTGQYAKEVGAKDFIMRPLTYGLIPDFTQYKKAKMKIEKVGGFFSPNANDWNESTTEAEYYLKALNIDEFHVYEAPKLEMKNNINTSPRLG